MRKLIAAFSLALLLFAPACAGSEPAPQRKALAPSLSLDNLGADRALILHYRRPDGKYDGWNVWAWPEGGEGAGHPFTGRDDYGAYAIIPIAGTPDRVGFIVRYNEWESRDLDFDRFTEVDDRGVAEIWISSGDPKIYTLNDEVDLSIRLTGAFLDARDLVTVSLTGPMKGGRTGVHISGPSGEYKIRRVEPSGRPAPGRAVYDVTLEAPVAEADVARLTLNVEGYESLPIFARDVLTGPEFSPLDAALGPRYAPTETFFQTWSPVASKVELILEDGRSVPLKAGDKGLWSVTVPGDLNDARYRYAYTCYGKRREVPDVHAFAATLDQSWSIVVDLDATDPEGFRDHTPPTVASKTDEVLYEVHVRDYSIADPRLIDKYKGTYLGLISAKARPESGLGYLLDLGVTTVHLLPSQDYPGDRDDYNWGYWTSFFNVPEGNYATPGTEGAGVITEFKTAVQQLHASGLRVVMDVVYNHTSTSYEFSPFFAAVPYYYFRTYADGRLRNDAGVGNAMADERPMVRKYILDSLAYWTTEYMVDGYRFDLMGCHHPETMAAVQERLLAIRPDLTLYGEPWTGGGPIYYGKGAQRGTAFSVFNDNIRNAIRGDTDGKATGFAVGPGGDTAAIKRGVAGSIDDFTDQPTETINYCSAHDNRTLWDKIEYTLPDATDAQKRAMQKLGLGIVLTCQGVPFLHGGSEYCRTKFGNHNSYNAGDEINAFDWARVDEYRDVYDYTKGLIALRKAHPAFRMSNALDIRRSMRFLSTPGTTVAYTIDGSVSGDEWGTIFVAYNGADTPARITLPEGLWTLVVNHERAGVEPLAMMDGSVELPAWSMVVAHD